MKTRFSKMYRTYEDWLDDHQEDSPYNRRIVNLHTRHPEAGLSKLRGHPDSDKTRSIKPDMAQASGNWVTRILKKRGKVSHVPFFEE